MLNTVKTLCALPGVSSWEDRVRSYLKEACAPYVQGCRVDPMGNLILFKKGKKSTGSTLLLTAHMDEVGIIIKSVTPEGYLKFAPIGGVDRRVLIGKRFRVGPKEVPGVVGLKAYHMVSAEEEKKTPKLEDLYLDIGASSRQEALKKVALGDVGVFESDCLEFGSGMLKAKALDDRVGCAVLLKLIREEELPMDCTFAFTVQEEVGTRGAFGVGFSCAPQIALVVEGTCAADIPKVAPHRRVCALGKGPVIPMMDRGTLYDRELFELLRATAVENGIPWQCKEFVAGSNDASALQRSGAGVRVCALAAPVRYIHTPSSVACIRDLEDLYRLTVRFLAALAARY